MPVMPKLRAIHINAINQLLAKSILVNGLVNHSGEDTRLAFIFDNDTGLYDAISQVLFSKPYDIDEDLETETLNEFNLYKLFFQGIGQSHFFLNESTLIEDIQQSTSLNDYCQRDHAYQQKVFARNNPAYKPTAFSFNCDYWVRYININNELVYATIRSADMDLYWQLEDLSQQLVEQAIPHTIDMKELNSTSDDDSTPFDIIVNANGKEQQLKQLQTFCRTSINELSQAYREHVINDEPSINISFKVDEHSEKYCIFVVNNEEAAKQVQLRDFEKSVFKLEVPVLNTKQQQEKYLHQFLRLFSDKLKSISKGN